MPVMIFNDDQMIVKELKKRKQYDLMIRQHTFEHQKDGNGHTYALGDFSDPYNGDVFIWFVGYERKKDNGWAWFHLIGGNPAERKTLYLSVQNILGPDSEVLYSLNLD